MSIRIAFGLLCLSLAIPASCLGRPVSAWSFQKLWDSSDLVAVIRPLSQTNAADMVTPGDAGFGHRAPTNYCAMNTMCEALLIMKTPTNLPAAAVDTITVLHFRYVPAAPEFNGGLFVYFDFAPTKHGLTVDGVAFSDLPWEKSPTYIAFLRRTDDGRFVPASGQYDSDLSFRALVCSPYGPSRYTIRDEMNKKRAEVGPQKR